MNGVYVIDSTLPLSLFFFFYFSFFFFFVQTGIYIYIRRMNEVRSIVSVTENCYF